MNKNKEKGMTLVELVIVIGIMSVVLAVMGLSINLIFSNKSKSAASNIYNMLGTAQTVGMSKNNCYIALTADDDNRVKVSIVYGGKGGSDFTVIEEKELDSKVIVSATVGGAKKQITSEYGIMIAIDHKTGSFREVQDVTKGWNVDKSSKALCSQITINHSSGDYEIMLSNVSGKYFYK